jgi:hypothetical protein
MELEFWLVTMETQFWGLAFGNNFGQFSGVALVIICFEG